jgi:cyclase
MIKYIFLMIALIIFWALIAFGEQDFSKETVTHKIIAPSLYVLEGAGGNITAFIGRDGTLLVDDDFREMADKILLKLRELKGDSPRLIVNTHFHYDHTGGNEFFGPTSIIVASTAVRNRLMAEQLLWKKKHAPLPPKALPTLTFDQSVVLHFNDEDVKVMHLPQGHTDGDSIVFFPKAKVVSLGDLYFSGMYPIFHPEHGGSLMGYIRNIKEVLSEISADYRIIPGHGPVTGRGEFEKYYQMILDSVAIVKEAARTNHSLAEIQKLGLPRKWESFSHGYLTTDQWIALLYKRLKCDKVDR